jgi:hypothetical protein
MGDVEVGGNVIRYPLAEGFALDYSVDTTQVKQNLIIDKKLVHLYRWVVSVNRMILLMLFYF